MAAAAGGRVTGMDGALFNSVAGHLVATNGALHDQMLDVIRVFNADRTRKRTD